MKLNYETLGKFINLVDERNSDGESNEVLGINIDKYYMPSVANTIGTDLTRYKVVRKHRFACNPMHVGRDERLPVALFMEEDPAIVSPAYFTFDIIDMNVLNPEYLMMWFRREEFDRLCWLKTDGSVRGGLSWDDLCRIELHVPSIEEQNESVEAYNTVKQRIILKQKINDNLHKFKKGYSMKDNKFQIKNSTSDFLVFTKQAGEEGIEVRVHDENVWLTQKSMAQLFDCSTDNIGLHLKNIFKEGELDKDSVTEKSSATASDGKNYPTIFYNLDAIIPVGYRVNSARATQFRQWATKVLKTFTIQGYVLMQSVRLEKIFQ